MRKSSPFFSFFFLTCPSLSAHLVPLSLSLWRTISIYIANRWYIWLRTSASISSVDNVSECTDNCWAAQELEEAADLLVTSAVPVHHLVTSTHPRPQDFLIIADGSRTDVYTVRIYHNNNNNSREREREKKSNWPEKRDDGFCVLPPIRTSSLSLSLDEKRPPFHGPCFFFIFFVLVLFSYLNRLRTKKKEEEEEKKKKFLKEKRLAVLEPSKKGVVIYDRCTHPDTFSLSFFFFFFFLFIISICFFFAFAIQQICV